MMRPTIGSLGHVGGHQAIVRTLWLLIALVALLLLNVIALWALV